MTKKKLALSEAQRTNRMDEFMRQEQARLDKEKSHGKESTLRREDDILAQMRLVTDSLAKLESSMTNTAESIRSRMVAEIEHARNRSI